MPSRCRPGFACLASPARSAMRSTPGSPLSPWTRRCRRAGSSQWATEDDRSRVYSGVAVAIEKPGSRRSDSKYLPRVFHFVRVEWRGRAPHILLERMRECLVGPAGPRRGCQGDAWPVPARHQQTKLARAIPQQTLAPRGRQPRFEHGPIGVAG